MPMEHPYIKVWQRVEARTLCFIPCLHGLLKVGIAKGSLEGTAE